METKNLSVNAGWVEVLFRKDPSKEFKILADIQEEDYEFVGPSPVPIRELLRPYDVYVMLHEQRFIGAPRNVAHGDVLNIRITSPVHAVRTYVLLNPKMIKTNLVGGTYRLDLEPSYPMGMLLLPHKFSSFWENKHTS
jgi:hypothetical protein